LGLSVGDIITSPRSAAPSTRTATCRTATASRAGTTTSTGGRSCTGSSSIAFGYLTICMGVGVARRAGPGAQAGQKYRVEGPGGSDDALAPDRVAVPVLRHLLRRPLAMGPHHQHLRSSLLPRLSTRPSSSAGRLVGPEGRPDRERHHFSPSRDCSTFLVHVRPRYIELRSEGYDPDQDAGAGGRVLEELEEDSGPEPEALPEQRQRR